MVDICVTNGNKNAHKFTTMAQTTTKPFSLVIVNCELKSTCISTQQWWSWRVWWTLVPRWQCLRHFFSAKTSLARHLTVLARQRVSTTVFGISLTSTGVAQHCRARLCARVPYDTRTAPDDWLRNQMTSLWRHWEPVLVDEGSLWHPVSRKQSPRT